MVSPKGITPVSSEKVVTEAEISKQARITTAELVPNTEICEASPSKNVLPEKGPSILSRQLNDHQTQLPVNELSQGITNSSTIANGIPKEFQIHDVDYVLAGDNVNISIKTRHTSRKKANKQMNLYNNIATKTRVPFKENSLKNRLCFSTPIDEVPLSAFLPNHEDNVSIRSEFKHIIGLTLAKYIPELSWFEMYLPKYIHHPFMEHTQVKSTTVSIPK